MKTIWTAIIVAISCAPHAFAQGDASRGAEAFRACAACHSLQDGRNLTGPSLAGIFGRKAGTLSSFHRYSPALKEADLIWDQKTLDAWLDDPAHFIPGNRMTFPGIKDAQTRTDLIAFLRSAPSVNSASDGMRSGGMMMGAGTPPNLQTLSPAGRVDTITYCEDTYRVTTADQKTHEFWERNLRFKTDGGADGPKRGAPAILGAGMMGDRASVIFSTPEEISAFIKVQCP